MAEKTVYVKVDAKVTGAIAGLNKVKAGVEDVAASGAKAQESLSGTSKEFEGLSRLVAAGAIGAGIAKAVASFAEFDAQMSAIAANTGATGAELEKLRAAALKAGADTQFSATEAADGISQLAKAGVSTTDIIGGGLTGALNLAAAGQIEVADAAEIAATAMTQFALSGAQVSHVADLLAAGSNKAQGSVGDLGFALKQSGLVAAQTGLSIEETTAGLTAFAAAGLIGSDAGTSFKSMLQRLTPQSQEAADLMKKLGISAYDSQGGFVGLEKLAGNLKDSLKDLTPEQRNAALATIFGSDAVRAASVLYKEGAEGIHSWTDAVNQQGFAARQAAQLTNNLKGDLERLGGSIDTAFIQAGSGANDVVRQLVQSTESLVNIVGQIPGPVLIGAGAFTALALVGPRIGQLARTVTGPLTGGMVRFREEMALQRALANGTRAQYDGLGRAVQSAGEKVGRGAVAMGAAKAAIGGLRGAASGALSVLGGPWGIALGAATVAVVAFAQAQANADRAGQEFADTLDEQTGAITELSRQFVGKKLAFDVSPEDIRKLEAVGVVLSDAGQAALDGGPKLQAYADHLDEMAASGKGPTAALNGLSQSVRNTGADVDRGKQKWQTYSGIIQNTAQSASAADRNFSTLTGHVDDYSTSASNATGNTSDLDGGLGDIQQSAEDAKKALDDLSNSLEGLGGGQRALRAAQRQAASDLEALTTAGKQDANGTKTQAERKREYQEAVDAAAGSSATLLKRLADEHVSVGTLKNTYDTQRAAVEKSLAVHGFHGKKLEEEADKILGTRDEFNKLLVEYAKNPEVVATQITTPGLPESQKKVEGYWTVINGVPTYKTTEFTANTYDASRTVAGLAAAIAAIHDKTVTITAVYRKFGFEASLIAAQARHHPNVIFGPAKGGAIDGPNAIGTGTSDSNFAMLSKGEHVLTAAEVAAAGGHGVIFALRKAIMSGGIEFHAQGGPSGMPVSAFRAAPPAPFKMDWSNMTSSGDTFNLTAVGLDTEQAVTSGVRKILRARDRT